MGKRIYDLTNVEVYCTGCRRTVDTLVIGHGLATQWALCPDCVAKAHADDLAPEEVVKALISEGMHLAGYDELAIVALDWLTGAGYRIVKAGQAVTAEGVLCDIVKMRSRYWGPEIGGERQIEFVATLRPVDGAS